MAEESIDSPVTPEKNELDSRSIHKSSAESSVSPSNRHSTNSLHCRASVGSFNAGDNATNATEKSDSANRSQNVAPRYLRASTGSCHDFCKYGVKHSSEGKSRKPLRKRNAKPLPNELDPLEMIVSGEQKNEKVVKNKRPIDGKSCSSYLKSSADTKSYSPEPKTSLDKGKVFKHKPSTDSKSHSPNLSSPDIGSNQRKPKMPSDVKTCSGRQMKTLSPKRKPSSTKKFPSPEPPEIIKSVCFPSDKVEIPEKQGSSTASKMPIAERKTTYPSKQNSVVESKPVKVKPLFPSEKLDTILGKERKRSDAETGRNTTASEASAKNILASPAASLSRKLSHTKTASNKSTKGRNLKPPSPLKGQNGMRMVKTDISNNEKVSEKTLHVIKTEAEDNVSESIPNDNAISSYPSPPSPESQSQAESSSLTSHKEDNEEIVYSDGEPDELISDNNETLEIDNVPPAKENQPRAHRKNNTVVSENEHDPPMKLKFRTGKAVDLQPEDLQPDNSIPRRLRFRKARVLGADDSKGALRRRTLKKAGASDHVGGEEVSSEKLVLKHQDVQDKKDAQGLFNNVIEETASKLVESRKSKVKALVGAFETVISLQDSKPSSS